METCEILYEQVNPLGAATGQRALFRFWAEGTNGHRKYRVAESTPWDQYMQDEPDSRKEEPILAHRALTNALLRNGWQPAGSGMYWWNDKFRRQGK
ncbi:MAG: hypothetical protein M3328_17150 [Chloroflexota bacterium]|nr:hypothetical protein [Chloroflexota bacterium]